MPHPVHWLRISNHTEHALQEHIQERTLPRARSFQPVLNERSHIYFHISHDHLDNLPEFGLITIKLGRVGKAANDLASTHSFVRSIALQNINSAIGRELQNIDKDWRR